ncbi:MAG: redoxin domain-containing protein [Candidatus Eisenbacteria bacterium]|nr:redoxin domain-containing protein [Candidatus Latescibacterota bacterium]MBD3302111.1 redoxin domain-containing protein [Candidatus Eisenbacteria bacterium]
MEFPHLQEIYAEHGGADFTILAVEVSNRPEMAKEMVDEIGAEFPVLVDEDEAAGESYGLRGYPTTWMIDREGRIVFQHLGFSPGDQAMLRAEVELLLEGGREAAGGTAAL